MGCCGSRPEELNMNRSRHRQKSRRHRHLQYGIEQNHQHEKEAVTVRNGARTSNGNAFSASPPCGAENGQHTPHRVSRRRSVYSQRGEEDEYLSCRDDFSVAEGSPCLSGTATPMHVYSQQLSGGNPLDTQETCSSIPGTEPSNQHFSGKEPGHQRDLSLEHPPSAGELQPTDKEHPGMRGLVSCLPILEALNLNLGQRERQPSWSGSDYCTSSDDGSDRPQAKPNAGCSLEKLQDPTDAPHPTARQCWQEGGVYNVRGVDYMRTKAKVPGEPSLYKVVASDVFGFPAKQFHIAESVKVPQPSAKCIQAAKAAGLPPMIIFNIQLPTYSAAIFGPYDGECISIISYTHLPEDFDATTFPNQHALGLIKRMVDDSKEADGISSRDRLKLVPRVVNIEEWVQKGPLSQAEHKLLATYNEKPILTRPQQFFYSGENYLEIDFDVHQYTYLARRAITAYIQRLQHVVWETAFIVQGNVPEELPEQVLAANRIYRLDFMNVRSFAGRCASAADLQLRQPNRTTALRSRNIPPSAPVPSNTQVLPDASSPAPSVTPPAGSMSATPPASASKAAIPAEPSSTSRAAAPAAPTTLKPASASRPDASQSGRHPKPSLPKAPSPPKVAAGSKPGAEGTANRPVSWTPAASSTAPLQASKATLAAVPSPGPATASIGVASLPALKPASTPTPPTPAPPLRGGQPVQSPPPMPSVMVQRR